MYTLPCTLPPRGARHRHLWPALAFGLLMPMGAMADAALSGPGLVPVSQISAADTAWVMVSTALVLLMTLPGIALFYGGMVRSNNVLNTMASAVRLLYTSAAADDPPCVDPRGCSALSLKPL